MDTEGREEMQAWLGPAAADMTEDHFERMLATDRWAQETWPDSEAQADRDAALFAMLTYLLGETSPAQVGKDLAIARASLRPALIAAQTVARAACDDGIPETEAARVLGLDRMTIRRARGK